MKTLLQISAMFSFVLAVISGPGFHEYTQASYNMLAAIFCLLASDYLFR